MSEIKNGSKVKVHYVGKVGEEVFDSSKEREQEFEFTVGNNSVINGFQKAVMGKKEGDVVEAVIDSTDGYGEYNENLKKDIELSKIPENTKVGDTLSAVNNTGAQITAVVLEINEENKTAVIDFNHPLAGKDLTFEIEILEVIN